MRVQQNIAVSPLKELALKCLVYIFPRCIDRIQRRVIILGVVKRILNDVNCRFEFLHVVMLKIFKCL